jgi:hypothetical protein
VFLGMRAGIRRQSCWSRQRLRLRTAGAFGVFTISSRCFVVFGVCRERFGSGLIQDELPENSGCRERLASKRRFERQYLAANLRPASSRKPVKAVSTGSWEVVQLAVHQILDLIILVRVQASQPIPARRFAVRSLLACHFAAPIFPRYFLCIAPSNAREWRAIC